MLRPPPSLPSLLNPRLTSLALHILPGHTLTNWLPSNLYTILLSWKLRVPIFLTPKYCLYGSTSDIFGDRLFSCVYHSKNNLHNHTRDTYYYILQHLTPLCNLTHSPHDIYLEPHSSIPSLLAIWYLLHWYQNYHNTPPSYLPPYHMTAIIAINITTVPKNNNITMSHAPLDSGKIC